MIRNYPVRLIASLLLVTTAIAAEPPTGPHSEGHSSVQNVDQTELPNAKPLRNEAASVDPTKELVSPDTNSPSDFFENVSSLVDRQISTRDTLQEIDDDDTDARDCVAGLIWEPTSFITTFETTQRSDRGDVLVRFPSPVDTGDPRNDLVAMEWYIARDEQSRPRFARAIVIVHESGSQMTVGRMFARALRMQGLHTFLIHLPHYGERRTGTRRPRNVNIIRSMQQSVVDVRRARDAVAAMPLVDTKHIALQGTSLGGFVSATAGSLDCGFDSVFLVLAGGNLYDLIENGQKDAAKVREELAKVGLTGQRLKDAVLTIEPTRVAHRLDPERTWLFSGSLDTVVPPSSAAALADAGRLDASHHVQMLANHYTGIIYLPMVLGEIHQQVTNLAPSTR
ncbi:MAG: alpha/beta hydrolase family protein [Rubripirellula sp.]